MRDDIVVSQNEGLGVLTRETADIVSGEELTRHQKAEGLDVNTYTGKQVHTRSVLPWVLLYLCACLRFYLLPRPPKEPLELCGRIISTSVWGRGIT